MIDLPPEAILFEDHHLIAVNKPAPLLVQAPSGIPSLESLVKDYIKSKYAKPGGVYLGVPHRLDRPVSGVILFCRNTKATQRVQEQFEKRTVTKLYHCRVEGDVEPVAGRWTDWLRKVPDEARVEHAERDLPGAKEAVLDFRVITSGETSLLELEPMTGRMHQLRAQCAWHGHPVLGDSQYGSTRSFGPAAELLRDRVIALHAHRLELIHPFTKKPLILESPYPPYWCDA